MIPLENTEDIFERFKIPILIFLLGLFFTLIGFFLFKSLSLNEQVEVVEKNPDLNKDYLVVEIAGAVEKPGVYKLVADSRIEDLLILAGGVSYNADREWMEKVLNRASKLQDGQKIYIPRIGEQSNILSANKDGVYQSISTDFLKRGNGLININTASQKELESLYGIGPVYAQKIIEHRPYSTIDELVTRKILKTSTFEKIKDKITVY